MPEYFYFYFRDHDTGAWGVKVAKNPYDVAGDLVVLGHLDKSVAAAVAELLNGNIAHARSLLATLSDQM